MKRSRLRPVSRKVQRGKKAFDAVYAQVDARSGGRCEACHIIAATEHHHTVKPRRSNHTAAKIIHLCRFCHRRVDEPYKNGRLLIDHNGNGTFRCRIVYGESKFAARADSV